MNTQTHFSNLHPFAPAQNGTHINGDTVFLGVLERNLTGAFRLMSKEGRELLRDEDWSGFMRRVHFYAMEHDIP